MKFSIYNTYSLPYVIYGEIQFNGMEMSFYVEILFKARCEKNNILSKSDVICNVENGFFAVEIRLNENR